MTMISFTSARHRSVPRLRSTGVTELINAAAGPSASLPRASSLKHTVFAQHCLFNNINPVHLDRLHSHVIIKSIENGTTIFSKGDHSSSLFIIWKGRVKISVLSINGQNNIAYFLNKGDVFGEVAFVDALPRCTDAIAIAECQLLVIERRDCLMLLREHPEFAVQLLNIICAHLRKAMDQVETLMSPRLPQRLAKALLRLAENDTKWGQVVSVTQNDLASAIGMTRESTNKQLREWQSKKLIRITRGKTILVSPEQLAFIADEISDYKPWSNPRYTLNAPHSPSAWTPAAS